MTDDIMQKWQHLAIEIGNSIYALVNDQETIGTDHETGYILMFFNKNNHSGKSTLVASDIDRADLKKLLKTALRNIDRATIIEQSGRAN